MSACCLGINISQSFCQPGFQLIRRAFIVKTSFLRLRAVNSHVANTAGSTQSRPVYVDYSHITCMNHYVGVHSPNYSSATLRRSRLLDCQKTPLCHHVAKPDILCPVTSSFPSSSIALYFTAANLYRLDDPSPRLHDHISESFAPD